MEYKVSLVVWPGKHELFGLQFGGNGGVTVYINRIPRDSNGTAEDARTASTLTLLEVAGWF